MDALTRPLRRAGLAAALLLLAWGALAQAVTSATEAAVKAAFLYKFAGYVEWPPSAWPTADAPFVIAVVSAEEVAAELEKLVPERPINNRRVLVRRFKEGDSLQGAHMLFVGRGNPNARALMRSAQQQGVLTVSESERGLEQGSAINFVVAEERVGFEVSLESAERTGVRISSRMLAVARRVVPKA